MQHWDLIEKIQDEIARLEKTRADTHWFMLSSEPKILILTRLLHLLTIPETFSKEERLMYFGTENGIRFDALVDHLLKNDSQFKKNGIKINNLSIINTVRNILSPDYTDFPSAKDLADTTSTAVFLKQILQEYGNKHISAEKEKVRLRPKRNFKRVLRMGDSLTDKGQMFESAVGSFSGLTAMNAPKHSFAPGWVWSDFMDTMLANETIIQTIKKETGLTTLSAINDFILTNQQEISEKIHQFYSMDASAYAFMVDGQVISANDAIGGLTAHSYAGEPANSLTLFFTRLIVSTLEKQRRILLEQDKDLSQKQKNGTVVIEWSGANDLITVNKKPTMLEADNAIAARMENLEALLQAGYTNFILFNLPDLSETPRYRNLSEEEKQNARLCTEYFNRQLALRCREMSRMYPRAQISIFDVNKPFKKILKDKRFTTEYTPVFVDDFDAHPQNSDMQKYRHKNKLTMQLDVAAGKLSYLVLDPCGQMREGTICLNDINEVRKQQQKGPLSAFPRNQKEVLFYYSDILSITEERGHTLDSIFTPLKSTKAFHTLEEERNGSIDHNTLLPGVNLLFYDDVHPSSDVQRLLYERFETFFKKLYTFSAPKCALHLEALLSVDPKAKDDAYLDDVDVYDGGVDARKHGSLRLLDEEELVPLQEGVLSDKQYFEAFRAKYLATLRKDNQRFFGAKTNVCWDKITTLQDIFDHIHKGGNRSKDVVKALGWMNDKDELTAEFAEEHPDLKTAFQRVPGLTF